MFIKIWLYQSTLFIIEYCFSIIDIILNIFIVIT